MKNTKNDYQGHKLLRNPHLVWEPCWYEWDQVGAAGVTVGVTGAELGGVDQAHA